MRAIETSVAIQATKERVWAVLTDFAAYADWNPFIRAISGDVREGARLTVTIHPPEGRPMTFNPAVQEASPGRELRWLGRVLMPGVFDGEHRFAIQSEEAGQVSFRQSEVFRGILVPVLPASMYERTRRGFEAMNEALKRRAEGWKE